MKCAAAKILLASGADPLLRNDSGERAVKALGKGPIHLFLKREHFGK